MKRLSTSHYCYVHHPNGRVQAVKNLGWVRRNWQGIERFEWSATPPREGYPMSPDGVFKVFMRAMDACISRSTPVSPYGNGSSIGRYFADYLLG